MEDIETNCEFNSPDNKAEYDNTENPTCYLSLFHYLIFYALLSLIKKIMQIRVISSKTALHPTWGSAFLRSIFPILMLPTPIPWISLYLLMIWDSQRQGRHDKIASTWVVRT